MGRALIVAGVLLCTAGRGSAYAWGCQGHRTVAILAERLVGPKRAQAMKAVLAASPVDPALERLCSPKHADPIVDQATWADDYRAVDKSTGEWHFIDYPRAVDAASADFKKFCPGGGCVIEAIVRQFKTLTTSSDKAAKANALRFILHFVGDVHQPLHTITNGDRGGNCLLVTYFGQPSNLHHVWDSGTIAGFMKAEKLSSTAALAQRIVDDGLVPKSVTAKAPTVADATVWAQESNVLANAVGYGKLAKKVPEEPALKKPLFSCADNNKVGERMAKLDEIVDGPYEMESMPVIEKQLALAGGRLAAILKAAFSAQ